MKHLSKIIVVLCLAGSFLAQGQFRAPGGLPPGFNRALLDVLGGGPAFSGQVQLQSTNGPGKDPTVISGSIAVLSGCMRLELNSFDPGTNLPPDQAANLRDMHSIVILRPDTNRMYLVYPDYKSYVELAYGKRDGTDATPAPKIVSTPQGKEPVGGQICHKSLWKITEANGEQYDATIWMATNLSSLPLQVRIGTPPVVVSLQDVRMDAPDNTLFLPPPDYYKYEGIDSVIKSNVEKAKDANSQ